ncbi:MAG: ABC transporter permease DevC [Porticoccaceae bacterium]
MTRRVPYAWLQLSHEKRRLMAAIAGIMFAVILVFMQLGLRAALFDSSVRFHRSLDYDLVMLSPRTPFLAQTKEFPRNRLIQAAGFDGVESVSPLYTALARSYYEPTPGVHRKILVIGIDPKDTNIRLPGVNDFLPMLREPDTVIMDHFSRREFNPIIENFNNKVPVELMLNERHVRLIGLYGLGASFGVDGSVITSDLNFLRIMPSRLAGSIDLGLIRVADGQSPKAVQSELKHLLPNDVLVLSRLEYVQREVDYWNSSTPIGYIFTLGAIIGGIVGLIIVYQILYSDVANHLAEYATLKAMGYTNGFLSRLVLQEALILSVLSFIPALGISMLLYSQAAEATQLPLSMTTERALAVLIMTILMCSISGLLAIRKLRGIDPAEVFA